MWSNCSWEKTQLFWILSWNSSLKYLPRERLSQLESHLWLNAMPTGVGQTFPGEDILGLNSTTVFSRGSNSISCKLLLKTRPHQSKDIYGSVPCDVQSSAWFFNCHVCLTCMFLNLGMFLNRHVCLTCMLLKCHVCFTCMFLNRHVWLTCMFLNRHDCLTLCMLDMYVP